MDGWYRPRLGGWLRVGLLLLAGMLLAVGAFGGGGVVFGTFAAAPLAQAVAVWPRHHGTPRHEDGALVLTFSRPRLVARIATWTAFWAGHAVLGGGGEPLLLVPGVACAIAAPVVALYRVPWRSALVLTPEAVTLARGRRRITTPWERVESIVAHDERTYVRETVLHYPGIRLSTKDEARRHWTWIVDGQRLGVGAATAYRALTEHWRR